MAGIVSYGAYIPRYRLKRMTIFQSMGWINPTTIMLAQGEKAVANQDEDSLTIATAAALDCLGGMDRSAIGGAYLASTTMPYLERQNAGIMAAALNLREDLRSADFAGAIKSGDLGPAFRPGSRGIRKPRSSSGLRRRLPPGQDGQPPGNDLWGRGGGFCRRRSKRHRRIQGVLFPDRGFRGPRARVQKLVRSPVGRPLDPGCGVRRTHPQGGRRAPQTKPPPKRRLFKDHLPVPIRCGTEKPGQSLEDRPGEDSGASPRDGGRDRDGPRAPHVRKSLGRGEARGPDSPGEFRQRLRRPAF